MYLKKKALEEVVIVKKQRNINRKRLSPMVLASMTKEGAINQGVEVTPGALDSKGNGSPNASRKYCDTTNTLTVAQCILYEI